jgi:type III restriction enzyme
LKFELIDYQREAASEVLKRLARAQNDWRGFGARSAFALSAMTGAGKTVIATAVIEAMLFGSADLGIEADTRATFLWVTDDPALNRQTRNKMMAASDLLSGNQLEILNDGHFEPTLNPGRVYFLNIQQLGKNASFANVAGDSFRNKTGWEIIGDTIRSGTTDLYVVVDEAHRGMRATTERASIVRQIIDGRPGLNPPAPSVLGISATIERFRTAMAEVTARTLYEPVEVHIERVRASGLVKDRIELFEPDESGTFSTTLLREAVSKTREFDDLWAAYAVAENEPRVLPILVIQVPDKASDTGLAELVTVVDQEWPGLGKYSVVNVFGEHTDFVVGTRTVRYVAPETIEDNQHVRVVLAKEAISTGWDCPRAEVLYSERPASDATHIAQVVGRMVRQPLARRITTDDSLNSVWCYLPMFKMSALSAIVTELNAPGEVGSAAEVVIHAALFERNVKLDPAVFEVIESAPCLPAPNPLANPIRRAKALAKLLTDDSREPALLPGAGGELTEKLNNRFAGLMVEYSGLVAKNVDDIETMQGRHTIYGFESADAKAVPRTIATAARDIDRDTRRIVASVKEGVAKDYLKHVVDTADSGVDILAERTKLAALIRVPEVIDSIQAAANDWVVEQLGKFRVPIKHSTGATKEAFLRVQGQTTAPEPVSIELPTTLRASTRESNAEDAPTLPTFPKHLFVNKEGVFPVKLNSWETTVLKTEISRKEFFAWYRNPSRATVSAHRIGYQTGDDDWASLQVDFLIVSGLPGGKLGVSLIDPHGDHLADAVPKLKGLASFAQEYGNQFVRIESIAEVEGDLRVLDLLRDEVREAIESYSGAQATPLYEGPVAVSYV